MAWQRLRPQPVRRAPSLGLPAGRCVLLLAALLAGAGCQSFGATAYNLRVLHEPDGSLAPRSATVAHWYYGWLVLTGERPTADDPAGEARVLSRPRTKIRRETVRLSSAQPGNPAQRAEQLSLACFLAARDRSPVTRELALEAVARAAQRWGLEALPKPPETAPGETEMASARALLGLGSGAPASDLAALDLAAACGLLDELLPGLRKRKRDQRLLEAEALLSRRASGLALAQALEDPQDFVRSRAARAVLKFDTSPLEDLLATALEREQPETVQVLCEHLAEYGWPASDMPSERRFELLVAAVDDPDDRASVAAARALTRLTEGALVSLRPEEWLLWWEQRRNLSDPSGSELPGGPAQQQELAPSEPAPAAIPAPEPTPPEQDDGH